MKHGIQKLLDVMTAMRAPQKGCPWDRAQTHESLVPYFKEELAEFLESLKAHGAADPRTQEELGDVLFQVVFHAELLREKKLSSFEEIAEALAQKLIDRHPHVFDPDHPGFRTPEEVNLAWQELKKKSRKPSAARPTDAHATRALADIPKSLAALQRAARMGEKMASYGFDWPTAETVWDKVEEEVNEVKRAPDLPQLREEVGDLFFALAQFCRKKGWDPEDLLHSANHKFEKRIQRMDEVIDRRQTSWQALSLTELEELWQALKHKNA